MNPTTATPRPCAPPCSTPGWLFTVPLVVLEAGLVLSWSSGFIGARFSLDHAPALLVVFWRCVVLSLMLLPFAWRQIRALTPRTLAHHAGIGLLAMAGYLGGVIQGIALGVPAGLAALFADLLPIGTAVLAALMGQRLRRGVWFGLAIGLCGVVLVTYSGLSLGKAPLWAYGLPLLGMLSLAVATLWQKHSSGAGSPGLLGTLWLQACVSSVVFGAVVGWQGNLWPVPTAGFAISVLWTALLSSLGGYGLYWLCLSRSNPTRVASVLYLSPGVTLLWAWCMFDEPLSWLMWVGTAVSGVGIWRVMHAQRA